ncbi:AlpA family phage regulatory protein [Variovorax dokdonensis]|uniref:AlpA family phage regulatory protein n=1 Tax=Variovorax dokdonensis TaxID=344883 RepID=A0ABT7NAQ5_9BURK|nr:AlpA family phage regulatory protein [Variovorax dokdonensis]MDM0045012.1 AlpA family phage regulatory protein [Variovorax dokdonensis]
MDHHLALPISQLNSQQDHAYDATQRDERSLTIPSEAPAHVDKLLRIDEVLRRIPVSKSSWYAGIKQGIYPEPGKLGRRRSVWRDSAIRALEASL